MDQEKHYDITSQNMSRTSPSATRLYEMLFGSLKLFLCVSIVSKLGSEHKEQSFWAIQKVCHSFRGRRLSKNMTKFDIGVRGRCKVDCHIPIKNCLSLSIWKKSLTRGRRSKILIFEVTYFLNSPFSSCLKKWTIR